MAQLVSASDCYTSPSGGSQFNPVRGRFSLVFLAFLMKKDGWEVYGLWILDGKSEAESMYLIEATDLVILVRVFMQAAGLDRQRCMHCLRTR